MEISVAVKNKMDYYDYYYCIKVELKNANYYFRTKK